MRSSLAIEWLKIKKYRTFWVLIGFFLVLLPLFMYQIKNGMINVNDSGVNIFDSAYSFPGVWGNVGFWGSIFVMFLSILVIILTTNEYNFRTNRQNVIDGWSRLKFYHAKVALVLAISAIATLYVFLLGTLFGLGSGSGSAADMFVQIEKIGYFFILTVNYLSFGLLIGIWIRRSGLAIGLFLLYTLIIEATVKGLLNWKMDTKLGDYLPLQASDELLPLPLMKMAQALVGTDATSYNTLLLVSIGWIALYYFIGRRLLLRSDW